MSHDICTMKLAAWSAPQAGKLEQQCSNSSVARRIVIGTLIVLSVTAFGRTDVIGQTMPIMQPKLLTIIREEVKVGRAAEHAKHEAGWPAAFAKAKSPDHYVAMTSMTGPTEAWYVVPAESHAAVAERLKREDRDPVLTAELARLSLADAEFVDKVQAVQTAGRPDLSAGSFPDLAKVRFFEVTTFHVRPGHQMKFEEAAKAYGAARTRVAAQGGYRVYQVTGGMKMPAFLVFTSVEDYAQFDQLDAVQKATFKALTADEFALLQKFEMEGLASVESNIFRVDPLQSYVSKETKDKDPDFWMAK